MKMDEMKPPAISVKGIFLNKLVFNLNNTNTKSPLKYSFEASYEYAVSPEKDKMTATLTIDCMKGAENPPFNLIVGVKGYFERIGQGNLEMEEYAKEMAASLLMPFVREAIVNITSRTPYPPLVLPPINIHALLKRQEATQNILTADRVSDKPKQ